MWKWLFLFEGVSFWILGTIAATANLFFGRDIDSFRYLLMGLAGVGFYIVIDRLDQIKKQK